MLLADSKKNIEKAPILSPSEIFSLYYHSIFNYPLTQEELVRWSLGSNICALLNRRGLGGLYKDVRCKGGYYFFEGKKTFIYQRILKKKISERKRDIAQKAAGALSVIPTIRMVGLTGALAMDNGSEDSDIDFLLITSSGTLWLTRIISYLVLLISGVKVRRYIRNPKSSDLKDKLCLNMWIDESKLVIRKRSIFSAHEICQLVPLINKNNTYMKFLSKNRWVKKYWPNAVSPRRWKKAEKKTSQNVVIALLIYLSRFFEPLAFKMQKVYMKPKLTKEKISPKRAVFHPFDWEELVAKNLEGLLG